MPIPLEQPTNLFRTATSLVQEELGRLERVKAAILAGARVAGIPTGFKELDDAFGGLNAGKLYFLGGSPGGGKTSLALNIALNAARAGYPVVYVTCDEGARRLALKMACIENEVRMSDLNRGGDATKLQTYISTNPQMFRNISIIESGHLGMGELGVEVSNRIKSAELPTGFIRQGLFVVDYLQAMASAQSDGKEIRLAIEKLCTALRQCAIENDAACLCISALSRGDGGKNYDAPELSSFRETSAIEYSADGVMVMFEDKSPPLGVSNPYLARKLRILKNRDGENNKDIRMLFNGATGKLNENN
jgi:replicative DNA helicase